MIKATLKRIKTSDEGTVGVLRVLRGSSMLVLPSLELPWRDNKRNVSCIPTGKYPVKFEHSHKFMRKLYEVKDVPGRAEVKFHKGNWAGDTSKGHKSNVEGCILLGQDIAKLDGQQAVTNSGWAIDKFHEFCGGEEMELEITEEYADG